MIETPCSANPKCIGIETEIQKVEVEDAHEYVEVEVECSEHDWHADDWFEDPGSGQQTPAGRRRRRALQACWTDCPMKMRLACLNEGMKDENLAHGIWGGYTEKQRQEIDAEIKRRKLARQTRGNAGAA